MLVKTQLANLSLICAIAAPILGHALIDPSKAPMDSARLVSLLMNNPQATKLDDVPAILPGEFLMNFVLKHGVKRSGERGHLVETKVSQSSDPLAPRAILYDERSGFSVSWNGGAPGQTAGQRLDTMSFDHKKKEFSLEQIDFPIQSGKPALTTSDCKSCHGPSQRPIFSMYPDWPSFYGSDNDELTGAPAVQKAEFSDYKKFRQNVVSQHPRYAPLFDQARIRSYLGTDVYPSYPYRPDVSAEARNTSRSFAFRPELRMGILYNRLTAQQVFAKIKADTRYNEFAPYFLFNLLQCSATGTTESKAVHSWAAKAERVTGQKTKMLSGSLLDYRQNWAIFGLRVNDIDIRYSYEHPGYANNDASKKVMEVGYIGRYFNSYFDGSATIDELVSALIYTDLSTNNSSLMGIKLWGLVDKYAHFKERFAYDAKFFRQMDAFGKWIHIPYPATLSAVHHREKYKPEFKTAHTGLCAGLVKILKK